jgi:ATP-dependent RNA helicase RhlE
MLDMGFLPDIKRIVTRLPARRQTLMFSATMPPVMAQLAREILRNPLTIEIGRHTTPVVGITQAAYPVREHLKTSLLRYLLRHTDMPSVLVFTRTRRSAKRIMKIIASDGFAVGQLHRVVCSGRSPFSYLRLFSNRFGLHIVQLSCLESAL